MKLNTSSTPGPNKSKFDSFSQNEDENNQILKAEYQKLEAKNQELHEKIYLIENKNQ